MKIGDIVKINYRGVRSNAGCYGKIVGWRDNEKQIEGKGFIEWYKIWQFEVIKKNINVGNFSEKLNLIKKTIEELQKMIEE